MTMTKIDDPRQYPPPVEFVDRINALTRDLAYGVNVGEWAPELWIDDSLPNQEIWSSGGPPRLSANLSMYFDAKWAFDETLQQISHPSYSFLEAWGYLQFRTQVNSVKSYLLTPKAFALLERPLAPPSVFISYARKDSTTFALLIEARLRLVGVPRPFVDKNLVPGEAWLSVLQDRVQQCKYFISLIGPNTLQSEIVQKEIAWALQAGCVIFSIWHGLKVADVTEPIKSLPVFTRLSERQVIEVKGPSAEDYESAVNRLLNALGYATY
jgi:hypothetical protein